MPSDPIFLDTCAWIALLNNAEAMHHDLVRAWREFGRRRTPVFLTDWIVAETGNGMARGPSRRAFAASVRRFQESPWIHILPVDDELRRAALDLYDARPDKSWGLVDCASFDLMRREGIVAALSSDRHFEQAGFRCLLPTR